MISTGTERLVATGGVPTNMYQQMKVPYMDGDFDLPVKYGYSLVGQDSEGHCYHVMHPHQSEVVVDRASAYKLPSDLPPRRAALISNMETVINAIWDSELQIDDKVAICGFGNIGSLLAVTLREHYGVHPVIIEKDTWRLQKATELGFETQSSEDFNIAFHTTATAAGLQYCIDTVDLEGKVIELSWYGDKSVSLALGAKFHYKRLQIISSQVGIIPRKLQYKYDYKSRKDLAVDYLRSDRYDQLVSQEIAFEQASSFYHTLRRNECLNGLIFIVGYNQF